MLKKIWNDAVWSKVIAGGILAVLGILITYFLGWLPAIVQFASGGISLLSDRIEIPIWALTILGLCALLVVLVIVIILWSMVFSSTERASYISYTEDHLFGIRWRWRYDPDIGICGLMSFCPHCDYQVQPRNISGFRSIDHIGFQCEDCGVALKDFTMPLEEVKSLVERKIQQNIRNGTWRKDGKSKDAS